MRTKLFTLVILCLVMVGCSTPKKVAYMQDLENGTSVKAAYDNAIRLQPEDKISIIVNTKDAVLSNLFNLPVISHHIGQGENSALMSSNSYVSYYTVTPEGEIDFPYLGYIYVSGMTRSELAKYIKDRLMSENLVKDPVVTVEFINAGVTIAGEVTRPGRYTITKDQINILEALGLAGDLTIQGRRENVMVIRNVGGKPTAYRVDLTDGQSLMNSPVYYLQQNDYVYVEPNNMKKRSSTVNGNTALSASFWVSVASLLTSVAVLIFK